jgi:DNA-binding PadR family transcriptional regulator
VVKRVEELSGGRVKLAAGSLYSVIDRLLGEGLLIADGEEIVNGRARRYYRLTEDGQAVLAEEADRLAKAARVVHDRLLNVISPRPETGQRPAWRALPA